MQFGSYKLVDPKSVKQFYAAQGHMTELISKCNHQEFRYIDGYGVGYFLLTDDISSETVSFTIDGQSTTLTIIDKIWLEHPDKSDIGLWVYVTAESKYKLTQVVVPYNRNTTIDKSLSLGGGVPTIYVMEIGGTPVPMSEVMEDIATLAGMTLSFTATDITSFDIAIDGMSGLEAVDHLCAIYGWLWTVDGTVLSIWELTGAPSIADPINDIHTSTLDPQIIDYSVSFPYYEYPGHRKGIKEYYTISDNNSGQGININVCDPYYPAVNNLYYASDPDEIRNLSLLTTRGTLIVTNLNNINSSIRYVQKNIYEFPPSAVSLSEVYGDWGDGPRSIYKWIPWPYSKCKIPPSKARFANNWRGVLVAGYQEDVAYFVVDPIYGFDGKIPLGYQRVVNVYGWTYGEVGWKIRVEWNPELAQWEALQQEYRCPPDPLEPEPYDPPDYEPPYYFPGE